MEKEREPLLIFDVPFMPVTVTDMDILRLVKEKASGPKNYFEDFYELLNYDKCYIVIINNYQTMPSSSIKYIVNKNRMFEFPETLSHLLDLNRQLKPLLNKDTIMQYAAIASNAIENFDKDSNKLKSKWPNLNVNVKYLKEAMPQDTKVLDIQDCDEFWQIISHGVGGPMSDPYLSKLTYQINKVGNGTPKQISFEKLDQKLRQGYMR